MGLLLEENTRSFNCAARNYRNKVWLVYFSGSRYIRNKQLSSGIPLIWGRYVHIYAALCYLAVPEKCLVSVSRDLPSSNIARKTPTRPFCMSPGVWIVFAKSVFQALLQLRVRAFLSYSVPPMNGITLPFPSVRYLTALLKKKSRIYVFFTHKLTKFLQSCWNIPCCFIYLARSWYTYPLPPIVLFEL